MDLILRHNTRLSVIEYFIVSPEYLCVQLFENSRLTYLRSAFGTIDISCNWYCRTVTKQRIKDRGTTYELRRIFCMIWINIKCLVQNTLKDRGIKMNTR